MGSLAAGTGHNQSLTSRFKKLALTTVLAAAIGGSAWFGFGEPLKAGGETRTLSLYHVHTKESLTITYKVDGRYIPSALSKINYLMRDWRRKEVIRIDPKTIDLMWELHADLGSTRPIHIICGYRSPKTNSFLKRIGRNVARKSQHMVGKAIDLYFPDVSTEKLRNSALVRQVGGVGYYRRSGPSGFVHIDSGNVRHWPRMGSSQIAKIFRDYRKTVGARLSRQDQILVAQPSTDYDAMKSKVAALADDEDEDDEAVAPVKAKGKEQADDKAPVPVTKPAAEPPVEVAKGYPVPIPRPKPIEVLMMAAATMQIEPASAPPPDVEANYEHKSVLADQDFGVVPGGESMVENPDDEQATNIVAKGSFADEVRDGTAEETPLIRPMAASAPGDDLFWWPQKLFNPDQAVRYDGMPEKIKPDEQEALARIAQTAAGKAKPKSTSSFMVSQANAATIVPEFQTASLGKTDRLEVNRTAKGSMLGREPVVLQKKQKRLTAGQFLYGDSENN
jgi:uncharacterized protein YcbK (DUF882 family)